MIYRRAFSPLLTVVSAAPSGCRYVPSCSRYTEEAVLSFGFFQGVWLGIKRISKCHPWSQEDSWDPVPNFSSRKVAVNEK